MDTLSSFVYKKEEETKTHKQNKKQKNLLCNLSRTKNPTNTSNHLLINNICFKEIKIVIKEH